MSNNNGASHGLAASIRAATESETFDLGGQSVSTITHTIEAAFSEPFSLSGDDKNSMIRLTFVVGAGKQARQRYDDGAYKAVTSTLQKLGYTEDRAASAVLECAGSYKMQHDTGKNLKTVVVFPKLSSLAVTSGANGTSEVPKLLDEKSPQFMIATCSVNVLDRMLPSKCPSWSQKKTLLAALENLKTMLNDMDQKLVHGTPLNPSEQDFYDTVTALDDKLALIKKEMQHQVETGQITEWELQALLQHNDDRLKEEARSKNKNTSKYEKLLQRKELLTNIVPQSPHPLRLEPAIRKLRKELQPLQEMDTSKQLKSIRETQLLAKKQEIEQEILALEEASRGWFEDDDVFQSRVAASRASFTVKSKGSKISYAKAVVASSAGGANSKSSSTVNKWVLPGEIQKGAWGKDAAGGKKKKKKDAGTVFSTMVMDSSDEDEQEKDDNNDEDGDDDVPVVQEPQAPAKQQPKPDASQTDSTLPAGSAGKTKKKKSNKKKGGGGGSSGSNKPMKSEDEALNEAVAHQKAVKDKEIADAKAATEVANPVVNIVRSYILPVLAALLTWFVSLVFGKPKRKRN